MIRRSVALVAGLLAAGCTMGPNFVRPDAVKDSSYTAESAPAGVSDGTPRPRIEYGARMTGDWWTMFGCEPLNRIVGATLEGNRTLAAMTAALAQTQELATAAVGTRFPQVALNAGVGRQKYGAEFLGTFKVPPFTYFAAGPAVSYTLDYDGAIARAIERQYALVDVSRAQKNAAYLSVTGQAVLQIIAAASARAQIAMVETLISQDKDNLRLVQGAFDAGSVARIDVVTAQSQVASDQTLLPPLRQDEARARHALAILVGKTPAGSSLPNVELADIKLPAVIPVSVPSELARRRPDILAAEAQMHAATSAVGIAEANLYPKIQLSAAVGQQALTPDRLFDGSSTAWSLISGLTAPIFDGGSLRAQKRAAVAGLRSSAANYQETVLEAFGQVANLLAALDHDAEQLEAQVEAVRTAQSALDLARTSYAEGYAGILLVLDAQRVYQQSQLGYVRAIAARDEDAAQLILALGGTVPPDTAGELASWGRSPEN
jgi:NodT family efflux transporter outer membrane factor (OMF) lipoprotein